MVGNKFLSFTSVSWAPPAFPAHHFEFAFLRRRRKRGGFVDDMLLSIFCTSILTESVCTCKQSLLSLSSPLFLSFLRPSGYRKKNCFLFSAAAERERGGIPSPSFPPLQKATFPHIPFGSRTGNRGLLLSSSFSHRGERSVPLVPPCPAEGEKALLDFHPPLF